MDRKAFMLRFSSPRFGMRMLSRWYLVRGYLVPGTWYQYLVGSIVVKDRDPSSSSSHQHCGALLFLDLSAVHHDDDERQHADPSSIMVAAAWDGRRPPLPAVLGDINEAPTTTTTTTTTTTAQQQCSGVDSTTTPAAGANCQQQQQQRRRTKWWPY